MIQYILKRLGYGFLVLFGVILIVFLLFNLLPSAANLQLSQRGGEAEKALIEKELGLDKPIHKRFVNYLGNLSPLATHSNDALTKKEMNYTKLFSLGSNRVFVLKKPYLGRSFSNRELVRQKLMGKLPQTVVLAMSSMLMAIIIGISLGIFAAVNQNTWIDNTAVTLSVLGQSVPSYFSALLLSYYIGLKMDWLGLPMRGSLFNPTTGALQLEYLVLPTLALGIRPIAIITQLTRSSMLDTLSSDFVRTARAKGINERLVVFKHTLRNALNPVVTAASGWFASLLAGAFFVEIVFDYKGLGFVTIDALRQYDFPVVMGSILIAASFFVLIILLTDILYSMLDKRIALK